jgi:DNA-binding transcriptional LysR family regulator
LPSVVRAANDRWPSNTVLIWLIFAPAGGTIGSVSLSQIRYFVAVAEEGNVGRAARRLRVAQPPVSRQIRALEEEIGTLLFERTPRGMTLLPPGRVFLEHAREILAAVDRAVVAAQAPPQLPTAHFDVARTGGRVRV